MSQPTPSIDLSSVVPLKYKAWVGLIGSVVSFVAPLALQASATLPPPWPVVIGLILSALTFLGVYKAPYKPVGTALVPNEQVAPAPAVPPTTYSAPSYPQNGTNGSYTNPWKQ